MSRNSLEAVLAAARRTVRETPATAGAIAALAALCKFAGADAAAGTCESPRGSNRGEALAKFFAADDYKPKGPDEGYPWCAAAISYWVQTWLAECPAAQALFGHLPPPRTARAFGLSEWAQGPAKGLVTILSGAALRAGVGSALPGDIAVFEFSHCGLVTVAGRSLFSCVEGNTDLGGSREGWQVAVKPRTPMSIRHLLRLSPRALLLAPEPEREAHAGADHA